MKKMFCRLPVLFIALMLIMSLTAPALADDDRTITVTGSATVSLKADMATVEIGVENQHADVAVAQSENTRIMNDVIAALMNAGIGEEDLITSNFNIYSGYNFEYNSLGQEERIPYYVVSNMLTVTVRDLSTIGNVLGVAVDAGANQIYGLNFDSTQSSAAYEKALTRAVEDAQLKARVLCTSANVELGSLLHMEGGDSGYYYGARNMLTMDAASAKGAAIVSGDVQVSASVTLVYEIK